MPLEAGARLGPYEIAAPIGAGGMGEVYRARDTRLDRTVAIKVLPASLAADPQLRERFDREARAISSLNHPHICTLYDVGHDAGTDFLVLEYLEGETLAERLGRSVERPLHPSDAVRYAIQIVDALDKAHRSGILHRDLKPGNVMITRGGAKLLDFGLAKTAAPVIATSSVSVMPTTPPTLTAQGTILGTFQYMAPEQIEGLEADARTDIFAFGVVLFEMLAGRPAFEGKTRAQLLGAILKDEPPPASTLQPLAPKSLDRIVAACLAKDPDDRWQTARDLLRELQWVSDAGAVEAPSGTAVREGAATAGHARRLRIAWTTAGVLGAALLIAAIVVGRHMRETPPAADAIQFTIRAPENLQFGGPPDGGTGVATQLAVSPNGRHVVFVARRETTYSLWLRPVAALAARQIPGTDDASFPFWSPDSRFVAFFAGGKLKKVQIAGGPPVVLCDAPQARGGTWNSNNTIVFGLVTSPLQRVSSGGGPPVAVTRLDKEYGETSHRWPLFLEDGRRFLFTAVTGAAGAAPKPSIVKLGALDAPDVISLFQAESSVAYVTGHLLFLRDDSLMAQPFDAVTEQAKGDPFPVAEKVSTEGSRYAAFSASLAGTLVYAHGGEANASTRLTWLDRTGRTIGQLGEPARYMSLAISPDERRVAVAMATAHPQTSTCGPLTSREVSARDSRSIRLWKPFRFGRRTARVSCFSP